MHAQATLTTAQDIFPFRERHREEMNCQIVHDSIHRRPGWTLSYRLELNGDAVGFGSVAIAGPWKGKPTVIEFYVDPVHRFQSFRLFETFLGEAKPQFMEVQSNDTLLAVMLHTYAHDIVSEKIVFHDLIKTAHPANGAVIRCATPMTDIRTHIEQRQGGPEWHVEMDGSVIGQGGILFHYNRPYGDIYMEIAEPFRRRGLGSWLVQELKREAYNLGAVPCARCNPANISSRRTLQKAGFVPFAHMLDGVLAAAKATAS